MAHLISKQEVAHHSFQGFSLLRAIFWASFDNKQPRCNLQVTTYKQKQSNYNLQPTSILLKYDSLDSSKKKKKWQLSLQLKTDSLSAIT